jgi:hypothetical protein
VKQVTALCEEREAAKTLVDALIDAGIGSHDVSVLVVDRGEMREAPMQHKTRVPEGAAAGAATGAVLGLALVAVGGLPGVLAMGPVVGALQGLTSGAAAGSVFGAIAGLGWWKEEADIPKDAIEAGGIVVGASVPDGRLGELLDVLKTAGARRIDVT